MIKIMTPGPTQVRENVRIARSKETTNPDLDLTFYEFYKETCTIISKILHTNNESFILSGEGILGLEAACASLTEPGDRVLVIDNGIFGKGFADFVKIYGGAPVLYTVDYHNPVDVDELKNYLEKNHNFKYATIVHCDTPSGVMNDVEKIGQLLSCYGILSVVDSVAGMFGETLNIDNGKLDIVCGGSQKALSAPVGLTFVTVSKRAFGAMENRKAPIAAFYANLLMFKDYYKNKWFPYTMPISDIYGLRAALDNILEDKKIIERHEKIAFAVRAALKEAGLSLYLESGYSNNVTVVNVPEGIAVEDILTTMKDRYGIMIAGCFDVLAGKVFRIGHMGENSNSKDVAETLEALSKTLEELGRPGLCNMREVFLKLVS
jgi:Serine-pyruvate aminotransferase/archaeal aspartate aminotransferase